MLIFWQRYEENDMRTIIKTIPRRSQPRPFFRAIIFKNAVERSDETVKLDDDEDSPDFYRLSYRVGSEFLVELLTYSVSLFIYYL